MHVEPDQHTPALADERGAILVLMAAAMPVMILLLAMVMDFGNWYIRTSQLQTRVDAAALAAGLEYTTRFQDCTAERGKADCRERCDHPRRKTVCGQANPGDSGFNGRGRRQPERCRERDRPGSADGSAGLPCTSTHPAGYAAGYWTQVEANDRVASFFAGFGVLDPTFYARARVQLMKAQTVSGIRPFVLADSSAVSCVSATYQPGGTVSLNRVNGSSTQWQATPSSFQMPSNSSAVSIKVGCGSSAPSYPQSGYVTRVGGGAQPRLTDIRLTPTASASCSNGNPYFIPRNGVPCQMTVTATVSFANANNQFVRAQVGNGGAFNLVKGSGNDWSGPAFTVNPRSGVGPNGAQPVTIFARNTANGNYTNIGEARIQAGTAVNQGPIANVELENHARNQGQSLGAITVTLRGLNSAEIETINDGVDCQSGASPSAEFTAGCAGPFKIKTGSGACSSAAPFDCVDALGSGALSSLSGGNNNSAYNQRWAPGSTCTPNNWPNLVIGDPRLLSIFLIDENNVNPSGSYPIRGLRELLCDGVVGFTVSLLGAERRSAR